MGKPEEIIQGAKDQLGSPYVYGAWGLAVCSVSLRKKYARYTPSQAENTYRRCQQLRSSNRKKSCDGCPYKGRLAFDCRGFVWWLLRLVGILLYGQSVGVQYNTKSNWSRQGDIAAMPDLVCAVFVRKDKKWKHVGMHVGSGQVIHCGGGEVQWDTVSGGKNRWTHYAIPAGLYTDDEINQATGGKIMRTLKKGTSGEDVRAMQEMLTKLGYDVGAKDGKADGIFGPKTEEAVKAFQTANGLPADGIATIQTLELLAARATDPDAPELPEDDDELDVPVNIVPLTYTEAVQIRDALRTALKVIEEALS